MDGANKTNRGCNSKSYAARRYRSFLSRLFVTERVGITSSFYIRMPNGTVQELLPISLNFIANIDEAPHIEGDFRFGRVCNIDPEPTDNWDTTALEEFLSDIEVQREGGGDV